MWLKIIENYYLTVLEARSLKPKSLKSHTPSENWSEGILYCLFLDSGVLLTVSTISWLATELTPTCVFSVTWHSPCVSLSSCDNLIKTSLIGSEIHPSPVLPQLK